MVIARTRRFVLGASGTVAVGGLVGCARHPAAARPAGAPDGVAGGSAGPAGTPAPGAAPPGAAGPSAGAGPSSAAGATAMSAPAPPAGMALTVDFRTRGFPLDTWSIGGTILTQWGRRGEVPVTIVTDAAWRAALAALGPLHWRVPLDMAGGVPSSAARLGGAPDGVRYLRAIRSIGGTPYPILQGNPRNNAFTPDQVAAFVQYLNGDRGGRIGGRVRRLILGNEPDNDGSVGVEQYLAQLDGWIGAAKKADPGLRISAPAASHWGDRALLHDGAARHRGVDILGYHAYDGSNRGPGQPGFPETRHYFDHMTVLRSIRPGLVGYCLEEVNFGDKLGPAPLYDYRNYVWLSSVIGQVISAGGNVSTFADLNGSYGMMNDGTGEDGQPGGLYTRLPAYWAVGMWTGMNGQFRRFGRATVPASSRVPLVDVFATDNGKIMVVNKDGTRDRTVTLGVGGRVHGRFSVWQSARDAPTEGPRRTVSAAAYADSVLELRLPAGTVSSVELD